MAQRPDCYGTMFPDLGQLDTNRPLTGKAFDVLVESRGIGVAFHRVTVQPGGWSECTACANYRDCYDLSMAKLTPATALEART